MSWLRAVSESFCCSWNFLSIVLYPILKRNRILWIVNHSKSLWLVHVLLGFPFHWFHTSIRLTFTGQQRLSIYQSIGLPCRYHDNVVKQRKHGEMDSGWKAHSFGSWYEVVDLCHVRRKKWKPGQGGISFTGMTSPSLWCWHFTVRENMTPLP